MNNLRNNIREYLLALIFAVAMGFGSYVYLKYHENYQRLYAITGVVLRMDPYLWRNDLGHFDSGYTLVIAGEQNPVDVSIKNWDYSIQEGDSVYIVVKPRSSLFGSSRRWKAIQISD